MIFTQSHDSRKEMSSMKRAVVLMSMMFVICMMSLIGAHGALLDDTRAGANVKVTLLNQEPDPVQAGEYVELRYKIENYNRAAATNFSITFPDQFPFTIDSGAQRTFNVGTVGKYQLGEQGAIVEFRVNVNPQALEGSNRVKVTYSYLLNGRPITITQEDEVEVRAIDATLSIQSVQITPETLAPGKQGTIVVKVANLATATLRDVSLKLDLSDDSLPFAPIGTATEQKTRLLERGESAQFTYRIVPYPDATAGVYKIPVEITLYDTLSNKTTDTDLIGVVVGGEPDLVLVIDEHDLTRGFFRGDVPLKIVNKGVVDVKFVDVHIQETNQFRLLSATSDYIGNIDSDDFETIDVSILNNAGSTAETILMPVNVTYQDANNEVYADEYMLEVRLAPAVQSGGIPMWVYLVIIVVIVGGVYWWKRKKNAE